MSWPKQILNWFRRGTLETGLDRELADHLERRVSDLLTQGLPEPEARRRAAVELGGVTRIREEVRDVWLSRWMRDLATDLRFSMRSLVLRNPVFAGTATLSLALGIGATTAIYSLVDQIVLKSLPVREPAKLVLIDWRGEFAGGGFGTYNTMPYPLCRDLREQQQQFFEGGVLCRAATSIQFSSPGNTEPSHTKAEIVSGNYFEVLGVAPVAGRLFTNSDEGSAPGENPVVVLAHDFWKRQFNSAPDIVGKKVLVNQHPMTIIGVAAPDFRGVDVGDVPSLWIPASMAAQALPRFASKLNDRRTGWVQILGRLRPEWTTEAVQAGLQPWFKAMLEEDTRRPGFPSISAQRRQRFLASTLTLTPAPQGHSPMRRGLERPLWLLLAATAFLLGLGCLNVAGLFLARGAARSRENTTRLALGASRGRIARQMLADALLMSVAGGLAGVATAPLVLRGLIAFMENGVSTSHALHTSVDIRLLLFATAVSLLAGLLSGLAPALQTSSSPGEALVEALRERGGGGGTAWLRKAIVTAQFAGSLILVAGAVLFARTLNSLVSQGPGFATANLVTFGVDPTPSGYPAQRAGRLMRRIQEELRSAPGVQSASVFRHEMLRGGSWNNPMTIQATPGAERVATETQVHLNAVTPEFFDTLGARIVAGRRFTEAETESSTAAKVAIVNETFVRKYLAGRTPLGALVCRGVGPDAVPDMEIVGVAADIRYRGLREQSAQAYFPYDPDYGGAAHFYVRFQGSPTKDAAQVIRASVRKFDAELPLTYFRTMDEHLNLSLANERVLTVLTVAFGAIALLLALVGLYGVMSFMVTQRRREIGVRLALGATRGAAVRLVMNEALAIVLGGALIGLPCVWALGRLVESQLYGVQPTDPGALGVAAVVMFVTAMGAAFAPAQRAARVHPAETLRSE